MSSAEESESSQQFPTEGSILDNTPDKDIDINDPEAWREQPRSASQYIGYVTIEGKSVEGIIVDVSIKVHPEAPDDIISGVIDRVHIGIDVAVGDIQQPSNVVIGEDLGDRASEDFNSTWEIPPDKELLQELLPHHVTGFPAPKIDPSWL
jgi:hypothetical protein